MTDILLKKVNETYSIVKCDRSIAQEISEYFSFFVPGYKFMPAYKSRLWSGKVYLANPLPNGDIEFYNGLQHHLEVFCQEREYSIEYENIVQPEQVTLEQITRFIEKLNIHSSGKKIEVRDYQIESVLDFLNSGRKLLLSPTSSGKSCILYIVVRYLQAKGLNKGLLLVPNLSLCHQLFSDFEDYSSHNGWNVDKYVHKIFGGTDKVSPKYMYISTWQSLDKLKIRGYFEQFDFILCDESHLASANSLTAIIKKCTRASYRLGVTGTLNGTKIHSLQLESLFGPVKQVITTKQLMDRGQVTELDITCMVLKYPEHICKSTKGLKYQDEIKWLIGSKERNEVITKLALAMKGNTLLLFQYVDTHGEVLYNMLKSSSRALGKQIYYIHGGISAEEREAIRKAMETQDNVILVGSVGTVSTGTNIKNLHNIIFTAPSKSRVRNLQAIGRVLRLSDGKSIAKLYDIADDLRHKKHSNYTILHFQERVKVYAEEKFRFSIKNVEMRYE